VNAMNINEIVYEKSRSSDMINTSTTNRKAAAVQSTEKSIKSINLNETPASLNRASENYARNLGQDEKNSSISKEAEKSNVECFQEVMDRMTEDDVSDLEKEGMSFEKYEAERLDRAVTRMKEQKQMREDGIEGELERRETQKEDVERAAIQNACEGYVSEQIIQALQAANLPLTKENAQKISQALDMSNSVDNLTDAGKQFMVQNQLEPTIQNFYQAGYIAHSHNAYASGLNVRDEENWNELQDQVKGILENAGIDVSDETIMQCKWLYENDLPINEDSLKRMNEIQSIQDNYDTQKVLEKIIDTYEIGGSPESTSLSFLSGDAKQVTEDFLKEVEKLLEDSEIDIKAVTSRRQLEEVYMKMTTEVSQKLLEKGIKIDIEHIQDVIDGLKQIEDDYYKGLLKEANVEPTADKISLLKDTTQKIFDIANGPSVMLGKTFADRNIQTVDTLHEAAKESSQQFERANESYETMRTEIRRDLGDSISKAFKGIDSILNDLGVEDTEANRRAVRILGYNNIEITPDSIMKMKHYDSKVQKLLDGMTPSVTVEMIKNGVNPLDTSIDELNAKINEIQEELGVTDEEKYSEFLWKLDKNHSLNEDERKAYIGIYRMLHQVEKSDGAAIGSVLKAGRELTLSNLMTAVKTSKSKGIDQGVDDSFGSLEELNFKKETISEQVEYYRQVTSEVLGKLTPDVLEKVNNEFGDISLEKLKEELQGVTDVSHKEYLSEKLDSILKQVEKSDDLIAMLEATNQPVTLENILSMEFVSNKQLWKQLSKNMNKEQLEEVKESSEEIISNLDNEEVEKYFDDLTEKASKVVNQQMENDDNTFKDISLIRLMGSSLCLTGSLARQENYHIPMIVGADIADVHVTILHREEKAGKVEVAFQSEVYGQIKAEFSVKEKDVKGFIMVDNQETLEKLRRTTDNFAVQVNELGLNVKHIDYGFYQDIHSTVPEAGGETASTKTLLTVAKTFISMIGTIE